MQMGKPNLLARKTPESFPRTPKSMRKKQHHRPAARLAHLVMAMTPLFYPFGQMTPRHDAAQEHTWANTESGVTVKSAEKKPPKPSPYIAAWVKVSGSWTRGTYENTALNSRVEFFTVYGKLGYFC